MIIRPAVAGELPSIRRMVQDVYSAEGYCQPAAAGEFHHHEGLDLVPETTVYIAESHDGVPLGTVTFTRDSPAGLPTDAAFLVETDAIRADCAASGLLLTAAWRLAVAVPSRHAGVMEALVERGLTDLAAAGRGKLVLDVHPACVAAWGRMIGAVAVAGPRADPSVANAPAALLLGVVPDVLDCWHRYR